MVETQIIPRGVSDQRVIEAMLRIPRHLFVPQELVSEAYSDHPLPIGQNQTISQPYIVALMTQLLNLKGAERVLEVGTGSGYQTALLAELAREVYTVERIDELSRRAKAILDSMQYKNVHYNISDGSYGWSEFAPYDAIIVTAAGTDVPEELMQQIAENGKMVMPIGERFGQVMILVEKMPGGNIVKKEICGCVFVPLVGRYGWE